MSARLNQLPIPGLIWGSYPERRGKKYQRQTPTFASLQLLLDRLEFLNLHKERRFVLSVRAHEQAIQALSVEQVRSELNAIQLVLRRDGFKDQHVAYAFALIDQICAYTLHVRLFDTQIIAAHLILNNRLAEMATGEGKTLAVALATATAAKAGVPVHVITANDYLAQRDADQLRGFYHELGLTVDAATQGQENNRRRKAYAADITYCTAKELVFDYLRDGMVRTRSVLRHSADQISGNELQPVLLRGLCMAIVDEADSILIDEARVPLILSQSVENSQEEKYYSQSLVLAKKLIDAHDFVLDHTLLQAVLTQAGALKLELESASLAPVWHNRLHREESVCQALAALYLFKLNQHYLVQDGKVMIIDETTGRVAQGRSWSRGLHQIIELKEGCKTTPALNTISQITYQRFFPRYLRLGGVSGTLKESRAELFAIYNLRVSKVPLRLPSKRQVFSTRLFQNHHTLWHAITDRVTEFQQSGRPVLVGTESVSDSETLSQYLAGAGIAHSVLNARNDAYEAELIAKAGELGSVTVTTNMAGRGTDILLDQDVVELGGLHIISCQINASPRIDRQLAGRCARQGDTGSVETWISLQTALMQKNLYPWLKAHLGKSNRLLPSIVVRLLLILVQNTEAHYHVIQRKRLLATDKEMERHLTFGGKHD